MQKIPDVPSSDGFDHWWVTVGLRAQRPWVHLPRAIPHHKRQPYRGTGMVCSQLECVATCTGVGVMSLILLNLVPAQGLRVAQMGFNWGWPLPLTHSHGSDSTWRPASQLADESHWPGPGEAQASFSSLLDRLCRAQSPAPHPASRGCQYPATQSLVSACRGKPFSRPEKGGWIHAFQIMGITWWRGIINLANLLMVCVILHCTGYPSLLEFSFSL